MTDQSEFNEQQAIVQPPPEVIAADQARLLAPRKKSKKWWLIGGGVIFLVVIGVMMLIKPSPPTPTEVIQAQPTVIPKSTQMEEELGRVSGLVRQADPESDPFPPPQVDMQVEF